MASVGRAGPLSCFLERSSDARSCIRGSRGGIQVAGFFPLAVRRLSAIDLSVVREGRRLSAIGKGGYPQDGGDGEGYSSEDDDKLKATVEKSKKALAAQKSLLQQVVYRSICSFSVFNIKLW